MRYLNEQYRQAFAFLRGPLAVYLKNTAITFAVIALVFYGTCLFLPNVRDSLLSYIQNIVDSAAIATEAGGFSALRILENTASRHSDSSGDDVIDGSRRGITWVLTDCVVPDKGAVSAAVCRSADPPRNF